MTESLQAGLRLEDTVVRLGGDEFTILLEDVRGEGEATEVAERITEELRPPFVLGEREVFAAPSIGIALGASSRDHPQDLLRAADKAMYQAKNRGKAYHLSVGARMDGRALKRLELEGDLRRAIEREEFGVHY